MPDRYTTPSKGSSDWDVPINENFERLDIDVEHRGSDDDRSDIVPQTGAKYLATDTGNVYIGNGTAWEQIGTFSGTSGEGSGDSVQQLRADGNVVAVYNGGVDSFDMNNESPVQTALDRCGEHGGGDVFLPYGTITEGNITFHTNCNLYGKWGVSGKDATIRT
ncbi:hypothetical protein [Halalkalicoccus ordinarius]|uniref:hypothetical protein n=1 Tax=Halalkalicoccus ordinarius TaxID=3116651 RepID=UPI00300F4269